MRIDRALSIQRHAWSGACAPRYWSSDRDLAPWSFARLEMVSRNPDHLKSISSSAFQPFCRGIVLPPVPVQKRAFVCGLGVSQTEITCENSAFRNIEKCEDCLGVEYRHPSHADAFCSGGAGLQVQPVPGRGNTVVDRASTQSSLKR
jgi:hypothetical protein